MIIDFRAPVPAPEGLYAYQANLLASRGGRRKSMDAAGDEKVEAALTSHLKFLEEAGTDLQLLSPRPYTMMHHEKPEYRYPLYEKLVELDVPCMIHGSTCLSSRLSYTLHFVNEESIAVISLLTNSISPSGTARCASLEEICRS
jgi:hypothetical protein